VKLDQEGRMTLKFLAERKHSGREIARLLGVDESTVRYYVKRLRSGAFDGRARQRHLAEEWAEPIADYIEALDGGPLNLADLHEWLVSEHDYPGSRRSVERYHARHLPKPKKRARRRVETPPGAQAQADWAE
jgi:transposase